LEDGDDKSSLARCTSSAIANKNFAISRFNISFLPGILERVSDDREVN